MEFLSSVGDAFKVGMTPAFTARRAPERVAVLSERGDRTFFELNARANQLARALRARGLRRGDALALMCSNRPEFVEVYAAVLRAGLRATFLNWHLQLDEAAYIVEDCEARALIAEDRLTEVAAQIGARLSPSLVKLSIGEPIAGFEAYETALGTESSTDIDDPMLGAVMLYTSGTTGRPKGVRRKPGADRPTVSAASARVPFVSGESLSLCAGPLYHAAPFAYNLVEPIHRGVGVVLMDKWDPEQTLRLIERHRVTHTHMVATMFHRLLALPEAVRTRYDLSSLKYVLHGAAPTPVHVKRAMLDWLGPVIFEYYAGTEGGGTFITPQQWLQKPGSVGLPVLNREVVIMDEADRVVPQGQVGRVFFSAPEAGGFEYFKDQDKTASAYVGRRFTLGDHGYLDQDGFLFLTGRTSELIISGGVNIYPAEIDGVLLMHPAVADVAVVGVPNDEFGEEVKAVVLPAEGHAPSTELAEALIAFCKGHLAHFKCPRSVDFVTELPRSEAGKVYRRRVRERYWQGLGREM
ncbi:MAG: AMP-binding protein [Polyangiales bacterium]